MYDKVITTFYIFVCLAMVVQFFWITKPRSENSTGESNDVEWYGLIDIAWIRDCRSNARNVLITLVVLVLFVLGNVFFLLHLASVKTNSNLYEYASTDPIIIPVIIAFLVAVYQVLLGEIFFINLMKKIKGTDMWILWVFFLIVISIIPRIIEVFSGEAELSGANAFYGNAASQLGQIGFLGIMASAVTIMYILWIYHALFVQLSVNDGFSLPQFVRNIRINILESIGRPRVLIQSIVIGPRESGKSALRRRMSDPLFVHEGEGHGASRPEPRDPPRVRKDRRRGIKPVEEQSPAGKNDQSSDVGPPRKIGPITSGAGIGEEGTVDSEGRATGPVVDGVTAGTRQVEFGYRDIRVLSPLTSRSGRRSMQLCHYMLDCAGELLGDHIFLPFSVRVDVLVVLIRAKALNIGDEKVENEQYWTLRAIERLWNQDHEHGRYARDYFRGLYSATRSDHRELSFRARYQPKSVVVVLNLETDDNARWREEEKIARMLKVLAKDIGKAFKIRNPSDKNCHAAVLNALEVRPVVAYEKVLNIQASRTTSLE